MTARVEWLAAKAAHDEIAARGGSHAPLQRDGCGGSMLERIS